jgi:hypothetical protein
MSYLQTERQSQTKTHLRPLTNIIMHNSPQFDCKRLANTEAYIERITKDSKPWASIVEILNNGAPYYHACRVDGLSFSCPTVVEAKSKLFADQPL